MLLQPFSWTTLWIRPWLLPIYIYIYTIIKYIYSRSSWTPIENGKTQRVGIFWCQFFWSSCKTGRSYGSTIKITFRIYIWKYCGCWWADTFLNFIYNLQNKFIKTTKLSSICFIRCQPGRHPGYKNWCIYWCVPHWDWWLLE